MYFFRLGVASANSIAFLQFEVLHCLAAPPPLAFFCLRLGFASAVGCFAFFCLGKALTQAKKWAEAKPRPSAFGIFLHRTALRKGGAKKSEAATTRLRPRLRKAVQSGAKRCKRHRCKAKKLKFMHLLILLLQT
jgi:hypothetical protein